MEFNGFLLFVIGLPITKIFEPALTANFGDSILFDHFFYL